MAENLSAVEVLDAPMSKGAARPLENQAKRHYRAAERNLARFAVDLRRLQDGQAHLTRGFASFGVYAQHTFDGLSAANAKKISIQGAVLLVLEHHQRIDLDSPQVPGATGLRALATVLTRHDEQTMLRVYDRASALRPERTIVDATVNEAVAQLLAPRLATGTPAATPDHDPPRFDDEDLAEDEDDEEDGGVDEDPEAVHELHDRLIQIRHALDDLGAVSSELGASHGRREAQRIVEDVLGEIGELPHALAAAIASRAEPADRR